MEAILFAADIIGVVMLLYWSIVNDDRKPGTPTTGLFAYLEVKGRRPAKKPSRRPSAASAEETPGREEPARKGPGRKGPGLGGPGFGGTGRATPQRTRRSR